MRRSATFYYALFCGVFLLLQGATTLAARLIPSVDQALPGLLATTQMVPTHSLLHIATALLGFWTFWTGAAATRYFAIGFGLFYVGLGVFGWYSGLQLCLGLQKFDHPFHIILGGLGLAAFGLSRKAVR